MEHQENELPSEAVPSAVDQTVATPQRAELLTRVPSAGGIAQAPKSQALVDLEMLGARGGWDVLLRLVRTIVDGLESDLIRERNALAGLKQELDATRKNYYSEKEKSAVLQSQIDSLTRMKILQNVFLTAGGVVAGLGAKLLHDTKGQEGGGFLALGGVFLFAGWLWPSGAKKKKKD